MSRPAQHNQPKGLLRHEWAWEFCRRREDCRAVLHNIEKRRQDDPLFPWEKDLDITEKLFDLWLAYPPGVYLFDWRCWDASRVPSASTSRLIRRHNPVVKTKIVNLVLTEGIPWEQQYAALSPPPADQINFPPKETQRPQPRKFPVYLAVWDLREHGFSMEEIGETVYPTHTGNRKKQAEKDHKTATEFINGGDKLEFPLYKNLLTYDPFDDTGVSMDEYRKVMERHNKTGAN